MDKTNIITKCVAVTERVKRLLFEYNKDDFAKELEIAKATLYRRIQLNNWTYREKLIIDEIYKRENNG